MFFFFDRISPIIVEPYNAVLSTHLGMDFSDCSMLFDNQALYEICEGKLNTPRPNYPSINRLISQVIACATCSIRYEGDIDLITIQTNIVPFKRIHFPLISYAPLVQKLRLTTPSPASQKVARSSKKDVLAATPEANQNLSTIDITNQCFKNDHNMVKCDSNKGKYISCCLLYRGDVSKNDVNQTINKMKEETTISLVDFVQTGT